MSFGNATEWYSAAVSARIRHRTIDIDGIEIFYREAGPADAPVLLLPHGYPSSSFQYRHLMPALADRWRVAAPDFPGFGYSATPARTRFAYTFEAYADLLDRFTEQVGLDRHTLYLFDYGSQIGFQLAMRHPERIDSLIIQNGDAYEDTLGPKYLSLHEYWAQPSPQRRAALTGAVTERGLREEILGEVPAHVAERISPDLWHLAWSRMGAEQRGVMVDLFAEIETSVRRFPSYQAYLREHQPPTLIVWGPCDGYMPEAAARAYFRDLPDAELHLFDDAGYWALETHLDEIVYRIRDFLIRTYAA